MEDKRLVLAEEFLRRLAAAIRAAQLYSANHPIITRNVDALAATAASLHAMQPAITIGIVGEDVVVGDVPVAKADALGDIIRRLQAAGVDRMIIERGVEQEDLRGLIQAIASVEPRKAAGEAVAEFPSFPHIRVGRIQVEQRVEGNLADMATIRRRSAYRACSGFRPAFGLFRCRASARRVRIRAAAGRRCRVPGPGPSSESTRSPCA